ncbi:acetylxylan esterase [Paenibacillus sp. JCM 10914]|uniref:acetylxylan esterase n=1 Tax=Paenibacillus sp. JCM 10914 TaxID=1236974 RepID=UPI0003CC270B|nr:acetylxylan esterase [Paenibacillus sp. JCM 10914]GAE04116.1 acetyl xylan esterase [Paenibacillus sp. JCM 10914]
MNTIEARKFELGHLRPVPTMDESAINQFWDEILKQHSNRSLHMTSEPEATPYPYMNVDKITYHGFDATPIHAWYITPAADLASEGARPCIVTFPGYSGDRGFPERYAHWLMLGYAVLAVDVRGQSGETGNLMPMESGVVKGWVSQGITDLHRSYYMALALDGVRAVEVAAQQPGIDPDKIAVVGGSQGGGLALLTAALNPRVAAVVADIPNMCRMDYGILHSVSSLNEIAQYIKRYPDQLDLILTHLAHFDMMNLAPRIKAPVMVSVGWKDTICMPETIYAAYNRIETEKVIKDYPFSGHEVNEFQKREAVHFLGRVFNNG